MSVPPDERLPPHAASCLPPRRHGRGGRRPGRGRGRSGDPLRRRGRDSRPATSPAAWTTSPTELETEALPQKTRIIDANGNVIAAIYDENRINVPLTQISRTMVKAIVSIEDSRFYSTAPSTSRAPCGR